MSSDKKWATLGELLETPDEVLVRIDFDAKTIDIVDGNDEFRTWEDPYYIGFNRIQTPCALIAWILHMNEKTWWTPEHANQLIWAWQCVTETEVRFDA